MLRRIDGEGPQCVACGDHGWVQVRGEHALHLVGHVVDSELVVGPCAWCNPAAEIRAPRRRYDPLPVLDGIPFRQPPR